MLSAQKGHNVKEECARGFSIVVSVESAYVKEECVRDLPIAQSG